MRFPVLSLRTINAINRDDDCNVIQALCVSSLPFLKQRNLDRHSKDQKERKIPAPMTQTVGRQTCLIPGFGMDRRSQIVVAAVDVDVVCVHGLNTL